MNNSNQQLTAKALYHDNKERLKLVWVAGHKAHSRAITRELTQEKRPPLIGQLNPISPSRIIILSHRELEYLESHPEQVKSCLFHAECNLVLLCDNLPCPERFIKCADRLNIALLSAQATAHDVLSHLRHYVTHALADRKQQHGVLMDVSGIGVLITGDPGIGKSELALELVTRGHVLVADDCPIFTRIAPDTIEGRCPRILRDFLEVRGLGVINVKRMYGHSSTRYRKILKLILRLEHLSDESLRELDRLDGKRQVKQLLDVPLTEIVIPVAPGRNLAVLAEAAVRNYQLMSHNYYAAQDLEDLQLEAIKGNLCD